MTVKESQLLNLCSLSNHVFKVSIVRTQVVKQACRSTENSGDVQVACNCQVFYGNTGRINRNY